MSFEYKTKKDIETRKKEAEYLLSKNDNKVPVIIERNPKAIFLNNLKNPLLVLEKETTLEKIKEHIKKEIKYDEDTPLFLIAEGNMLLSFNEAQIGAIYEINKNPIDLFLYIHYSDQASYS